MAQPRKRRQPARKSEAAKDDDSLSGCTAETRTTSPSDSGADRKRLNIPSALDADVEILKVLYAVQFTGFLRFHTLEEWTRRWTTGDLAELPKCDDATLRPIPPLEGVGLDDVPDYILEAILVTRGVSDIDFKNAIRLLEARGDIRRTREDNWYGRWCTEDDHVIEVSWGDQPLPPLKPPYHVIVHLDGEFFREMCLFNHPIGQCYAITAEGIKRAEAALGKRPDTGATQPTARHPVEPAQNASCATSQKPRVRRGRKPDSDPNKDARIVEAWASRQFKTFADLERELELKKGEGRRAVDRHRKRK